MYHKELGWTWTGFTWLSIGPCVRDGLLVSQKELCFLELAGETLRLQQLVETYGSGASAQLSYLGKTEILGLKPAMVPLWPHKLSRNRTRASALTRWGLAA